MSELKRCPFCGGDNVSLWYNRSISPLIPTTCEVHCYDCHFGLQPSKTKEDAIARWNTRKPVEKALELLEEGKEYFKKRYLENFNEDDGGSYNAYTNAIEIIKEEVG